MLFSLYVFPCLWYLVSLDVPANKRHDFLCLLPAAATSAFISLCMLLLLQLYFMSSFLATLTCVYILSEGCIQQYILYSVHLFSYFVVAAAVVVVVLRRSFIQVKPCDFKQSLGLPCKVYLRSQRSERKGKNSENEE